MQHATASSCLSSSYALLGVAPGASEQDIRKAFESLAKQWHPDRNRADDAAERFQALVEAYDVIRAAGDGASSAKAIEVDRPAPPVLCTACRQPLRVPQCRKYVGIASFLLWSWQRSWAGFFCDSCDDRAALRASLVSGLLGWWSLQGVLLAPLSIAGNAAGGRRDRARTLTAYCRNVLAYHALGDLLTVRYLSALLLKERASVPVEVRLVMEASAGGEADLALAPYFEGGAPLRARWLRHLACIAVAPSCLLILAVAATLAL